MPRERRLGRGQSTGRPHIDLGAIFGVASAMQGGYTPGLEAVGSIPIEQGGEIVGSRPMLNVKPPTGVHKWVPGSWDAYQDMAARANLLQHEAVLGAQNMFDQHRLGMEADKFRTEEQMRLEEFRAAQDSLVDQDRQVAIDITAAQALQDALLKDRIAHEQAVQRGDFGVVNQAGLLSKNMDLFEQHGVPAATQALINKGLMAGHEGRFLQEPNFYNQFTNQQSALMAAPVKENEHRAAQAANLQAEAEARRAEANRPAPPIILNPGQTAFSYDHFRNQGAAGVHSPGELAPEVITEAIISGKQIPQQPPGIIIAPTATREGHLQSLKIVPKVQQQPGSGQAGALQQQSNTNVPLLNLPYPDTNRPLLNLRTPNSNFPY